MLKKLPHKKYVVHLILTLLPLVFAAILSVSAILDNDILHQEPHQTPLYYGNGQLPDACKYFLTRERFQHRCNASTAIMQAAIASSAGGCLLNSKTECKRPDMLLTHTWIDNISWDDVDQVPKLQMLLRSWLITQDLRRSRYQLWTAIRPEMSDTGAPLPQWFRDYHPYVSLHFFNYSTEIVGTPLEHSRHFHSWEKITNTSMGITTLSDVVRNLLLHNYGGIWLDNDAVPLRDLWNITAGLGLQLIPKFPRGHSNNHILYIACPRSALAQRRLHHLVLFPYDFPDAWPRAPLTGLRHWVYNDALSEHTLAVQASTYNISREVDGDFHAALFAGLDPPYDDLEVPMPMGWFDPVWACEIDNLDFFQLTACGGAFIWHRLARHPTTPAGKSWRTERFWQEIMESESLPGQGWSIEPQVIHAGEDC